MDELQLSQLIVGSKNVEPNPDWFAWVLLAKIANSLINPDFGESRGARATVDFYARAMHPTDLIRKNAQHYSVCGVFQLKS